MAGNVATGEAVKALADAGADCEGGHRARVHMYHTCSGEWESRSSQRWPIARRSGYGVEWLDGGIKCSGDITKALAARACCHDRPAAGGH